ncbi:MAG: hypothetical protein WBK67_02475 [Minisyncoccales bacterium]
MEVVIFIVLVVAIFFIYNGFATRCPNCGSYKLHAKDKEATKEDMRIYNMCKEIGATNYFQGSMMSIGEKPNYKNAKLKCNTCGYSFSRREALIWLTTANKLGKDIALREYKKMKER